MAVATSKAEPTAKRIIEHFGLDDHFEVVAGASVDGSRSSKADVLARALAQLEPLPQRVLMVGDRSHDVLGAAAHGINTVVVGWGYGAGDFDGAEGTEGTEPYRHVASVADLRQVLGV
jgi:phosphoglycolate phosphatase-like HAD superfamily hydrolase